MEFTKPYNNVLVYGSNSYIGQELINSLKANKGNFVYAVGSDNQDSNTDMNYIDFANRLSKESTLSFDSVVYLTGRPQRANSKLNENPELFSKNTFEFFKLMELLEETNSLGKDCSVVYLSSGHSVRASDVNPYYASSKAAVNSYVLSKSKSFAKFNEGMKVVARRRINAVAPEAIASPMIMREVNSDPNVDFRSYVKSRPNFRLLDIKEVIDVIEFMISDKSSGINGQVIVIGGSK